MPDHPMHTVSCTAVVFRDGKVLGIQRADNGKWCPPGGIVETGETIHECVIREALEETGVDVRPVRLTGVYKNINLAAVTLAFECEYLSGELRTSAESADVRWMTMSEAETLMIPARFARVLDASLGNAVPYIRTHDGQHVVAGA